jgi:hypothetical protein
MFLGTLLIILFCFVFRLALWHQIRVAASLGAGKVGHDKVDGSSRH